MNVNIDSSPKLTYNVSRKGQSAGVIMCLYFTLLPWEAKTAEMILRNADESVLK